MRDNRTGSLREENLPLRGSRRGPPKTPRGTQPIKTMSLGGFRRSSQRPLGGRFFFPETLGPLPLTLRIFEVKKKTSCF